MKIDSFKSAVHYERQALMLWKSLADIRQHDEKRFWRLSRLMGLAWQRYQRRIEIRHHWFDIEQGTCNCFSCSFLSDKDQKNSGDSARLPADCSPVLSADTCDSSPVSNSAVEQGGTTQQRAEQGIGSTRYCVIPGLGRCWHGNRSAASWLRSHPLLA